MIFLKDLINYKFAKMFLYDEKKHGTNSIIMNTRDKIFKKKHEIDSWKLLPKYTKAMFYVSLCKSDKVFLEVKSLF